MSKQGQRRAAKAQRRKIRKITIETNGRKVEGLPFMGERMTCVMCGRVQQSNPAVKSNWRVVQVQGVRYYVCPAHFPPDRTATQQGMSDAYLEVLKKVGRVECE